MPKHIVTGVRVMDTAAFHEFLERLRAFVDEYAWHTRDCAAIDADGEWRPGNAACDCEYDAALARLAGTVDE